VHTFINAVLLALLLPAGGAERAGSGPACKAEVQGLKLLTAVQLPGGMVVEGPWRIVHGGELKENATHYVMLATLDHVIERDMVTGEQKVIPFPEPVKLAFEGTNQRDLVERAAQIWCVTVMRAQENQALDRLPSSQGSITRIAALPQAHSRGS
jgi:hypothetical protein